jgi:retron-type reverse transcriptase
MWLLSNRIGDKRLLRLIHKMLKTNILTDGLEEQRTKGTPQGSPLSPLLSNIVLDKLDQELNRRGLSFVRYEDDVQKLLRSQKSAERVERYKIHRKQDEAKSKPRKEWHKTLL